MPNYKIGAASDLPVKDGTFDRQAAMDSVFEWAGWDGNDPGDPAKARRGFGAYDADNPKLKGSYHLPFARVEGGVLTAIGNGVRNALSRMEQMDPPLPQAAHDRLVTILNGYIKTLRDAKDGEDTKADPGMDTEELFLTTQARLVEGSVRAATEDELSTLAEKHSLDPSIFEEAGPARFFTLEASNNRVDSFGTRMMPSTLRQYAADATDGRPIMPAHNIMTMPLGRTVAGKYVGAGGNGLARTEMTAYTIPGLSSDGVTSDGLIRGMQAGIYRDTSVGFSGGRAVCSLCGNDMFKPWWQRSEDDTDNCYHIPGMDYPVKDAKGKKTGKVETAIGNIEDAGLREVSIVYKGATPGAQIKAMRMARAGLLTPDQAEIIQVRHHIVLPPSAFTRRFPGVEIPAKEEAFVEPTTPANGDATDQRAETAPEMTRPSASDEMLARLEEQCRQAGKPENEHLSVFVRRQQEEIERLRPLADIGTQYRADLTADALAEGVRAHGDGFATESYKALLEVAPLDTIKQMRADWKKVGDKLFPGGRVTQDDDANAQRPKSSSRPSSGVPASVYRA